METKNGIINKDLLQAAFNRNMSIGTAILNKGLFRTIIVLFVVGMALAPFSATSEDGVYVPDRDHFIKWTEPGDHYMKPQKINSLKSKYVSPADMGIPISLIEKPASNRDHVWNYLIKAGFSDEQAAGIMGNLQQEHGFQTSGDGLAQWMGGRRARLMRMNKPYSLNTQLNFLVNVELAGSYSHVKKALLACNTVAAATTVFCNKYERPGIPAMSKRQAYARNVYNIYHKDESDMAPILVIEGSTKG
jgi:hypothetical protein